MNIYSNYHSNWVLYNVNKKVNEVFVTLQMSSPVLLFVISFSLILSLNQKVECELTKQTVSGNSPFMGQDTCHIAL